MTKVRGVLIVGVVIALTLGITAIPGSAAPEKIFSLKAPSTVAAGTQSISLTLKNETPSGNSSMNSLKVTASGGVTINSATAPSGQVATTPTSISISNIPPIKNKQIFTITANVTATSAGCAGSATWDSQSWTGSSFSGDTFRLLRTEIDPSTGKTYSNLTTAITRSCSLRFNPAPVDSTTGTNIPVTVQIVSGSDVVTGFTGTITLSATPSISGTGSVPITNGTASAAFTLNGSAIGTYTATASSTGLTSVSASFTLSDALLNCTAPSGDPSRLYHESGTAGTANITLTDPGDCTTSIPVSVDASQPALVTVTKPDVNNSMYLLTIQWVVPQNNAYPLYTEVDTGTGFAPLVFCDAGPSIPAGQLWCVADSHTYVDGTTKHFDETYIGTRDVTFKRHP